MQSKSGASNGDSCAEIVGSADDHVFGLVTGLHGDDCAQSDHSVAAMLVPAMTISALLCHC